MRMALQNQVPPPFDPYGLFALMRGQSLFVADRRATSILCDLLIVSVFDRFVAVDVIEGDRRGVRVWRLN